MNFFCRVLVQEQQQIKAMYHKGKYLKSVNLRQKEAEKRAQMDDQLFR